MRSGGIDLSTNPRKTGVATIEWGSDDAVLTSVTLDSDDDALFRHVQSLDKSGIDCPYGRPTAFVDYVTAHRSGGQDLVVPDDRGPLLLRTTDRQTIERTRLGPARPVRTRARRCPRRGARSVGSHYRPRIR